MARNVLFESSREPAFKKWTKFSITPQISIRFYASTIIMLVWYLLSVKVDLLGLLIVDPIVSLVFVLVFSRMCFKVP